MSRDNLGMKAQIEECKQHLKVGTKVYRAYNHGIEEGVVTDIFTCTMDGSGDIHKNSDGTWIGYSASFREGRLVENQIIQHKWFSNINDARRALIKMAESTIESMNSSIKRMQKIILENEDLIGYGEIRERQPNPFSPRISQK